jgi:hypothetical protein
MRHLNRRPNARVHRQPAPRRNYEADAVLLIGLATSDRLCVRTAPDGSVLVPAASRSSALICLMIRTTASLELLARL